MNPEQQQYEVAIPDIYWPDGSPMFVGCTVSSDKPITDWRHELMPAVFDENGQISFLSQPSTPTKPE